MSSDIVLRKGFTLSIEHLKASDQLAVKSLLYILTSRLSSKWLITAPDKASVWMIDLADCDNPEFFAQTRSQNIATIRVGDKNTPDLNWDIVRPISSKNFIDVLNAISESASVHTQLVDLSFFTNLGPSTNPALSNLDNSNACWKLKRWPSRTTTLPHRARIAVFLLKHQGTRAEIAHQCAMSMAQVSDFFSAITKNNEHSLLLCVATNPESSNAAPTKPAFKWVGKLRQQLGL